MFDDLRSMLVAAFCALAGACDPNATGLGIGLVPEQEVEQMGAQAWQQMRAETPASSNSAYQRRAEAVADKVLRAAGENPSAWEVTVFASDQVNAFALPGGKIGVYEGMMKLADSDAELATVIAHEVAHNRAAHAAERVNSQAASQLAVDVASTALGAVGWGDPGMLATVLGAGAQYGVILPYSRNQELEADRLGLAFMAKAGYDPETALGFWRKMSSQGGAQPPTFLSTHPGHDKRMEQLHSLMPEAKEIYRQSRG